MSKQILFDSEYVGEAQSTDAQKQESELKKFIRQPIKQDELQAYGTSKPVRIIIRAKLIDGKS